MSEAISIDEKYAQPHAIDVATAAFPASVIGTLMPHFEDLPSEYRSYFPNNRGCNLVSKWFSLGLREEDLPPPKPGIDRHAALKHISAVLRSFEPKHEHKISAAGWLFDKWFEDGQR